MAAATRASKSSLVAAGGGSAAGVDSGEFLAMNSGLLISTCAANAGSFTGMAYSSLFSFACDSNIGSRPEEAGALKLGGAMRTVARAASSIITGEDCINDSMLLDSTADSGVPGISKAATAGAASNAGAGVETAVVMGSSISMPKAGAEASAWDMSMDFFLGASSAGSESFHWL